MELTKEISYDKDLKQNDNFTLKYSGELFKNGSEQVYIVYGYDKEWKNTTEQIMQKQNDCFSINIQVQEFDELNFCFKNSANIWDNNNNSDYHLPIMKQENIEFDSTLNELLDQILNEVKTPSQIETQENKFEQTVSYFEKLFDELFVNNQNATISSTSNIQTSSESDEKNISYFEKLFDELFVNNQNATISSTSNIQASSELDEKNISYFEKLFDELFVNNASSQEINSNLDLEETFPEEFETIIQPSSTNIIEEKEIEDKSALALTTTSKRKSIFAFENLSPLYVLRKRLRLALYKLIYVLPAFLFGEEDDSEN